MKWKKKKGCLFLGSLILSAVLMAGCSGQDPETKQLRALCEELFSFPGGRQVDLYLKEKKSDEDGYMTWDVEHWSSVDGRRFIRCYSLEGRVLSESTGHNIYDLKNEFKPEEAEKVELS